MRTGDWIQTYTGKKFFPLDPHSDEVHIEDIAHSLSMIARFAGHALQFYSVAQHCCLVSKNCPDEFKFWGLLHDASEAYISDIPRPLKRTKEFEFYRQVEKRIMNVVCDKFGLPIEEPAIVKKVDTILLVTEARDLMDQTLIKEWDVVHMYEPLKEKIVAISQQEAEKEFLSMFYSLAR